MWFLKLRRRRLQPNMISFRKKTEAKESDIVGPWTQHWSVKRRHNQLERIVKVSHRRDHVAIMVGGRTNP